MTQREDSNPFLDLWNLGYTRLVPVIPPGAEISDKSSLAARARAGQDPRGKAPGVRRKDGAWTGLQFTAVESTIDDLGPWHAMRASVGVKTGRGLVAIDIDTRDKAAAQRIYTLAGEHLGPAHVRFGQHPKCLLLYEVTGGETGYRRVTFSTDVEDRAAVEVLSEGRQFVAHGVHPKTGKPYAWPKGVPARKDLSRITKDALDAFLHALTTELPGARLNAAADDRQEVDQETLKAPSWEALERAVNAMPNTSALFPTREDYVRVAYAIKAAAPEGYEHEALELYLDWCDRWTDGANDPDVAVADWNRAKAPYRIGYDFILEHAPALYFEPVAQDDTDRMFAQANQEKPKRKLEILLRKDIDGMQPMEYLIGRHVPKGGLGFLYGAPGAGKSFLALDMALTLAYQRETWHGDAISASQNGWVIYLAREGSAGFKARIEAWEQQNGAADSKDNCRFALIREHLNFMRAEDIQTLIQAVEEANLTPIDLIVVDTVSRVIPGADENLQKDMTLFVQACEALQQRFDTAVMGVHHAGKSGEMRGSTVFKGAGDFIFTLSKDEKTRDVRLHCAKQKDIEDGWTDAYTLEGVQIGFPAGDEEPRTSLVPRRKTQEELAQTSASESEQERMLQALQAAWDAGAPWTLAPRAIDRFGPRQLVVKFGIRGEDARAYLDLWQQQGLIEIATCGRGGRVTGFRRCQDVQFETETGPVSGADEAGEPGVFD